MKSKRLQQKIKEQAETSNDENMNISTGNVVIKIHDTDNKKDIISKYARGLEQMYNIKLAKKNNTSKASKLEILLEFLLPEKEFVDMLYDKFKEELPEKKFTKEEIVTYIKQVLKEDLDRILSNKLKNVKTEDCSMYEALEKLNAQNEEEILASELIPFDEAKYNSEAHKNMKKILSRYISQIINDKKEVDFYNEALKFTNNLEFLTEDAFISSRKVKNKFSNVEYYNKFVELQSKMSLKCEYMTELDVIESMLNANNLSKGEKMILRKRKTILQNKEKTSTPSGRLKALKNLRKSKTLTKQELAVLDKMIKKLESEILEKEKKEH